ncbi:MAG TPA: protein kinase [Planctomycetota bacterium]|jgi:serine/threonine protein kinase
MLMDSSLPPNAAVAGTEDGSLPMVGGVRLQRLLGEGGMGQVYLGWHTRLNILVAVKLLKRGCALDEPMFVREARLTARIEHPNLVRIFDVDKNAASGETFIVMEYVQGTSAYELLKQHLDAGTQLSETAVLRLALMTAKALSAAHAKFIVHRDVKPDNILVRRSDGAVKLTDLGLAAITLEPGVHREESLAGTMGFLAPEAVYGQEITPAADVYGLGATMYELLTGDLPYSSPYNDTYYVRQISAPVPDPRRARPDLSPCVADLVARCLARDPKERFADGRELSVAIEAVLRELEPSACPADAAPPRRVICVDDEPEVLSLVSDVLQSEGFEAHGFSSAEAALERLSAVDPQLAVVDLRLPGIDGLQLAREIWKRKPDCAVLILSGQSDTTTVDTALAHGVSDFLNKPLSCQDLVRRAKLLCRSVEMSREQQRVTEQLRRIRRRPTTRRTAAIGLDFAPAYGVA